MGACGGVVVVVSVFSQLPVFTFFGPLWWCADLCLPGCQLQARRKAWPALPARSWAVPPYPLPRQQFLTRFSCFPPFPEQLLVFIKYTRTYCKLCVCQLPGKKLKSPFGQQPDVGTWSWGDTVPVYCIHLLDNCLLLFTTELHSAKLNYKVLSQVLTHPKYPFVTALQIAESA